MKIKYDNKIVFNSDGLFDKVKEFILHVLVEYQNIIGFSLVALYIIIIFFAAYIEISYFIKGYKTYNIPAIVIIITIISFNVLFYFYYRFLDNRYKSNLAICEENTKKIMRGLTMNKSFIVSEDLTALLDISYINAGIFVYIVDKLEDSDDNVKDFWYGLYASDNSVTMTWAGYNNMASAIEGMNVAIKLFRGNKVNVEFGLIDEK